MECGREILGWREMRYICAFVWIGFVLPEALWSQTGNPFQPLSCEWASPSASRLASGAPGPTYWQQRANYKIAVVLDDVRQRLTGEETITYYNHSPHTLSYLWMQLDQNLRKPDAMTRQTESARAYSNANQFDRHFLQEPTFLGGFQALEITNLGQPMAHTVVETNMRVDLTQPLLPGDSIILQLKWAYPINDARLEGRSGFEYFPEDGNHIYEVAQFYPRMCVYDDVKGWENTPFYGPAEFGLEFGNFDCTIDVPADHIVNATGTLVNPDAVLSKEQVRRLSMLSAKPGLPQYIVKPEEALLAQKSKATTRKIWHFQAQNVRDIAFASSRKFIWDAAETEIGGKKVRAQSFYPSEAMPLWDKYATHTIIHTLKTYSGLTLDYPYAVASAVNGPVWGMEYPMLAFCGGRPTSSGYYSRQAKYMMIGVVIHEVGHNFFPMVVNSDERRWAWMDEGLNSFCQIIAEKTFEHGFPLRRGAAASIADFMLTSDHQPIMTNPESLRDNGAISYEKTAIGLNILRNEVMGPVVFDMAFKEYVRRWAFKHPEPADFFRTMEDASGHALSWFWRTWFYEAQPMEMGISRVKHYLLNKNRAAKDFIDPHHIPLQRKGAEVCYVDGWPELKDRYSDQTSTSGESSEEIVQDMMRNAPLAADTVRAYHVYQVSIERNGGCILPIQLEAIYVDGTRERFRLPAEVWMTGLRTFVKEVYADKAILGFVLDPEHAVPDTDRSNDFFPREEAVTKFETADLRK
jgi:Peptidase family M1 domain